VSAAASLHGRYAGKDSCASIHALLCQSLDFSDTLPTIAARVLLQPVASGMRSICAPVRPCLASCACAA